MTSGQMWNHIRGPPYAHKNPQNGQVVSCFYYYYFEGKYYTVTFYSESAMANICSSIALYDNLSESYVSSCKERLFWIFRCLESATSFDLSNEMRGHVFENSISLPAVVSVL